MLISEKTTGSIYLFIYFFASKEAYPIVRQLEKITMKKAQAKVVKCAKNKSWVPRNPPPLGHLSVNTRRGISWNLFVSFSELYSWLLRRNQEIINKWRLYGYNSLSYRAYTTGDMFRGCTYEPAWGGQFQENYQTFLYCATVFLLTINTLIGLFQNYQRHTLLKISIRFL